ncbi:DUF6706 family protein [Dyadobacter bucti]|uniref:DUF6706 family protein n=1 Tax=Dyadobacter bucti TaxID=2572203 RepID=UPI001107F436|nr:DUF6706 family protein [Dyadobacter bucti]
MTNLQAIKHLIGSNASVSDERLAIAAELAGIDLDQDYNPANNCAIYGLVISEIQTAQSVKRVSEGNYSIEYSDPVSSGAIGLLVKQSGCAQLIEQHFPKPTLKNVSNRW